MTDPYAVWDASYVLGSLSRAERHEYEAHLSGCKACRTAVGELSGMPALLGMLSPAEAAVIDMGGGEPPPMRPDLLDDLLDQVRRRRGRIRRAGLAAAALVAAILAVVLFLAVRPWPPESPPVASSVSMTPVAPSSLEATVAMTKQGWGTHVQVTCTYRQDLGPSGSTKDDAGDELAMVAVGRDGTRVQLATWMAQEGTTASPAGSTSMAVDDIGAVQIVMADTNSVLLQRNF